MPEENNNQGYNHPSEGRGMEGFTSREVALAGMALVALVACSDGTRVDIHDNLAKTDGVAQVDGAASQPNSSEAVDVVDIATQVSLSPNGYVLTMWANKAANLTLQYSTGPQGKPVETQSVSVHSGASQNFFPPKDASFVVVVDDVTGKTIHATMIP